MTLRNVVTSFGATGIDKGIVCKNGKQFQGTETVGTGSQQEPGFDTHPFPRGNSSFCIRFTRLLSVFPFTLLFLHECVFNSCFSLQSAAGHFECRVSGLRWVCKGKTSFQYQFRSWEGHMERMESRQYMPAGPLMDVTVTEDFQMFDISDILHIDDCGDVVETVSEVTPTHVKLTEPHFSLIGALIRLFFPLKISCYTLMYYKPNTSFLKLHVYPIRQDPALEQNWLKSLASISLQNFMASL
uniref:FIIND domain-containing protein n=1 Tax=Maylandia zebra TaxID=106582 RepID=A0A3P9BT54_9CICH